VRSSRSLIDAASASKARTILCSAPVSTSSSSSERLTPSAISLMVCSSHSRRRLFTVI
jgi:hypothetical protein